MISQVESFLYLDKQETSEEGRKIHQPKHCVSNYHLKNKDNSPKNYNQNSVYLYIFTQAHRHVCVFVYLYECVFVCVYIYIYIYTHTHTYLHMLLDKKVKN